MMISKSAQRSDCTHSTALANNTTTPNDTRKQASVHSGAGTVLSNSIIKTKSILHGN